MTPNLLVTIALTSSLLILGGCLDPGVNVRVFNGGDEPIQGSIRITGPTNQTLLDTTFKLEPNSAVVLATQDWDELGTYHCVAIIDGNEYADSLDFSVSLPQNTVFRWFGDDGKWSSTSP